MEIQPKVWDKGIGRGKENVFLLAYHRVVLRHGTSHEKQWYILWVKFTSRSLGGLWEEDDQRKIIDYTSRTRDSIPKLKRCNHR